MRIIGSEKKTHLTDPHRYTFSSIALYTLFLFLLSLFLIRFYSANHYEPFNPINAYIAFIAHFMAIFFTVTLYKNAAKVDQKILFWLAWINIGLLLDDLAFFILVYKHGIQFFNSSFFIFLLDLIPALIWFVSSIIFLSRLLLAGALSVKGLFKVLIPFFIVNLMMIYLFLSSTNYAFPLSSWQNVVRIPTIIMHFIIFDLAILCLIHSKHKGLSYFFIGLTVLVSGDMFVIHSSLSQTHHVLAYGEQLWVLGLLFMVLGLLTIAKTGRYTLKNWCNETNTMKIKLTFWTFSACLAGFLVFFTIAFCFSIINEAIFLALPIFIMLYSIVIVILSVFIGTHFGAPFRQIENNIRALMYEDDKSKINDNFSTQEFMFLQKFIVETFEFKEAKNLVQKKLTSLAAQVAHDIRSPLSALNTCLKYLPQIPENQRILMRNAANRINDIANNLLQQYSFGESCIETHLQIWLLAPLLESILSEKRLQFDGQPIQLEERFSSAGFFAFAEFDLKEMKRVLSNLINNAAEALSKTGGQIIIVLDIQDEWISLQIKDNGHGISQDKLTEVLKVGVSFKEGGSGLGLPHAKETIEAWNGILRLHSSIGQGTTIDIQLPSATPPQWFTSEIIVDLAAPIAILDDDQSVHDAWDQRLGAVSKDLIIHHFNTPQSFMDWYQTQYVLVQIFSDYELLGEVETGLDVFEKLQISNNGILVTSYYENPDIIKRCHYLGIRLLPKNLLAHIQIDLKKSINPTHLDLIFIDDNTTLRNCWQLAAESNGKSILTFASITEFEKVLDHVDPNTPLYIDSELSGGIKGEECAKELFERGFREIYLATGHPADHFDPMPWIRAISDKYPPF